MVQAHALLFFVFFSKYLGTNAEASEASMTRISEMHCHLNLSLSQDGVGKKALELRTNT